MDQLPLMHYKGISTWVPKVGDIIIKYGWLTRTKWFGVIKEIDKEGNLNLVTAGSMLLLAKLPANASVLVLHHTNISSEMIGSYAVMQHTPAATIWYI